MHIKEDDKLNDLWLRLIGIPCVAILGELSAGNLFEGIAIEPPLKMFALAVISSSVMWTLCRQALLWSRKKYPGIKFTRNRILFQILCYTIINLVVTGVYVYCTAFFNLFKIYHWTFGDFILATLLSLCISFTMGGIYEALYFFRHWKRTTQETEQLKRESLQSQFESLKNQVNPHFLFNSLNSLSSLIEEDTDKAEQFVQEMSQVYRYLLQTNDKTLTTLAAELNFIQAYFYLLKTRFSEALQVQMNVPDKFVEWQISPLTLQMLVENAVKHNIVSTSKPLKIKIFINDNNELVVANNMQRKTQSVLSNKIGLENITVKYKLLNQRDIVISETAEQFEVKVPLISKDVVIDTTEEQSILTEDYIN